MKIRIIAFAIMLGILSCNTNDKKATDNGSKGNNATTSESNADQKKSLNEQSRACIALMNTLEEELNAANASKDTQAAAAIQLRIDSAAEENVKIGQKIMALENK